MNVIRPLNEAIEQATANAKQNVERALAEVLEAVTNEQDHNCKPAMVRNSENAWGVTSDDELNCLEELEIKWFGWKQEHRKTDEHKNCQHAGHLLSCTDPAQQALIYQRRATELVRKIDQEANKFRAIATKLDALVEEIIKQQRLNDFIEESPETMLRVALNPDGVDLELERFQSNRKKELKNDVVRFYENGEVQEGILTEEFGRHDFDLEAQNLEGQISEATPISRISHYKMAINQFDCAKATDAIWQARRIAAAYYRTNPGKDFVDLFRERYPSLHRDAITTIDGNLDLEPLMNADELKKLLLDPTLEPEKAVLELKELAKRQDLNQLLHFGFRHPRTVETTAALSAYTQHIEFINQLLYLVAISDQSGPIAALFAALLDQEFSLQHFGKILADAALEPPNDPTIDRGTNRAATLIVVRALLPYIGSPLPRLYPEEMNGEVAEYVVWVDNAWKRWLPLIQEGRKAKNNLKQEEEISEPKRKTS